MNNKFKKNCVTVVLLAGSLLMCMYLWENIEFPSLYKNSMTNDPPPSTDFQRPLRCRRSIWWGAYLHNVVRFVVIIREPFFPSGYQFCKLYGLPIATSKCKFEGLRRDSISPGNKAIPLKVNNKQCFVNTVDRRKPRDVYSKSDVKMIYFITPTYPRPEQVPELIRLGHTLMHVPRLHWIIADDEPVCSVEVFNILRRTGLPFTHLSSPKPFIYKTNNFPRGVSNRRAALDWIRENIHDGILYFGDDDNTYDLRLFEEIRITKRVSMFPVGLIGGYGVSSPVVRDGKVVAFFDSWPGARMFPVDMAGFAVNIDFLKLSATMPYIAGLEENGFLVSLGVNIDDIEPLAENCSKVFVWHTKTNKYKKPTIRININKLEQFPKYESFVNLLKEITSLGMANLNPVNGNRAQITRNKKSNEVLTVLE